MPKRPRKGNDTDTQTQAKQRKFSWTIKNDMSEAFYKVKDEFGDIRETQTADKLVKAALALFNEVGFEGFRKYLSKNV